MPKKENKLLIFTKSPILGEVKTRLQPEYSPEQSLAIHKTLLLKTLALTNELDNIDIELCCAPDRNTLFFLECENSYPITLTNQQGVNLGERMAYSLSVALQTHQKVVIIGTDCPELNKDYITQAFNHLNDVDTVIGPAEDGGYVLLGLQRFAIELCNDFQWGSDAVLAQTRQVLNELSFSYEELGIMHDLDRPEDLARYKNLFNEII